MDKVCVSIDTSRNRPRFKILRPINIEGYVIPSGYTTDGCSSPRLLWSFFPQIDKALHAYILHDYLVDIGHPWKEATKLFNSSLKACGVGRIKRGVMTITVTLWGKIRSKKGA